MSRDRRALYAHGRRRRSGRLAAHPLAALQDDEFTAPAVDRHVAGVGVEAWEELGAEVAFQPSESGTICPAAIGARPKCEANEIVTCMAVKAGMPHSAYAVVSKASAAGAISTRSA